MKLKDIANHQFFSALWGFGVISSKYREPFDNTEAISAYSEYWMNSIYHSLHDDLNNSLNACNNVRNGIYRLSKMKDQPKIGYVVVNNATGEVWTRYYDGTIEELNILIDTGTTSVLRYIDMYSKGNVIMDARVVDLMSNVSTPYHVATSRASKAKDTHTASAYMFHKTAELLYLNNSDLGDASYFNRKGKVLQGFMELESMLTLGYATPSEIAVQLTLLENDIYCTVAMESGQSPTLPFGNPVPISGEVMLGEVPTDSKATSKTKKASVKRVENVKKLAEKGEYKINDSFVDNEADLVPKIYDHYIPSSEVISVCKLLKGMNSLPETPVMNMMFTGEAGTGKSTAAQLIARIVNLPYRFMTMSADTTVADLLLNILPSETPGAFEHHESELVKAFRNGGVIEIQEVNTVRKPNVLTSLNATLDDLRELHLPNGKIIKRHPNCIVVFTANVGYEGTGQMNQALLSRCFWKSEFELPANDTLVKRLVDKSGIDKSIAENMVKCMHDIKKNLAEEGETNGICSFREVLAWAKATVILGDVKLAAENTIVNSGTFDLDLRTILKQTVANYFA